MNFTDMHSLNTLLFEYIHGFAGHYKALDAFFIAITSYTAQGIVFGIVATYIFFYIPFVSVRPTYRLRAMAQAGESFVAMVTTWFVILLLKVLVAFPRPFETMLHIKALIVSSLGDSFPSGHAAMSMALAITLYVHHPKFGKFLFVCALGIGFSRIYVGVHYPLDVLAGWVIGYTLPLLFHKGFSYTSTSRKDS